MDLIEFNLDASDHAMVQWVRAWIAYVRIYHFNPHRI